MDENDLREDRDLWKQSEETCSRQYDKLLAEHSALREQMERFRILLSKDSPTRCDYDSDRSFLDAHRNWENRVRQAIADYRADYPKDGA